jgi:hypothetical protein
MSNQLDTQERTYLVTTTHELSANIFSDNSPLMRRISSGTLFGELGHPKQRPGESLDAYIRRLMLIDEHNVCFVVSEACLIEKQIMVKVRSYGPKANIFNQLNEDFSNTKIGVRAFVTDNKITTIITFDLVVAHASTVIL